MNIRRAQESDAAELTRIAHEAKRPRVRPLLHLNCRGEA